MTRLSSHFRNQADEARVARVWSALDQRFETQARRAWLRPRLWAVAMSATLLLLAFAVFELRRGRGSAQVIELADGSRVEHGAPDTIEIASVSPERVELRMKRGRAQFRVARNPRRAFLTHAGGYTIRVIGTEYTVDLSSARVSVEVARGEVEVRRDGTADVWRVRKGELWSSSRSTSVSAGQESQLPDALPAEEETESPRPGGEGTEGARAEGEGAERAARPREETAAALFQRAQDARIAGQGAQTERLLAEFLRHFPRDRRAGLAAFELGRLRLEAGDARGAIAALDRAESAGAVLSEQVQARRVQALEELGDGPGCRAARETFLTRFPEGTFAEVVRRRCP